eukprot:848331-Prymnesium_polylepis.1
MLSARSAPSRSPSKTIRFMANARNSSAEIGSARRRAHSGQCHHLCASAPPMPSWWTAPSLAGSTAASLASRHVGVPFTSDCTRTPAMSDAPL